MSYSNSQKYIWLSVTNYHFILNHCGWACPGIVRLGWVSFLKQVAPDEIFRTTEFFDRPKRGRLPPMTQAIRYAKRRAIREYHIILTISFGPHHILWSIPNSLIKTTPNLGLNLLGNKIVTLHLDKLSSPFSIVFCISDFVPQNIQSSETTVLFFIFSGT